MEENVRILRDHTFPCQYWTGTRWSLDEDEAKLYTLHDAFIVIARRYGFEG